MFYVTMTDKFLSYWGMSEGKTNKLVLTCETYEEAEIVEANARNRSEMIHVNIRKTKPYYPHHYVSWHDKTDYTSWYTPNYFKPQRYEREKVS